MEQEIKDIENLEKKAMKAFLKYCMYSEMIEKSLRRLYPDEKDVINEILYQPSDGVCVRYEDMKNIPLSSFLKGNRV